MKVIDRFDGLFEIAIGEGILPQLTDYEADVTAAVLEELRAL